MNETFDNNHTGKRHASSAASQSRERERRIGRTLLIIVLALIVLAMGTVVGLFLHFYNLMNTGKDAGQPSIITAAQIDNLPAQPEVSPATQTVLETEEIATAEPVPAFTAVTPAPTPEVPKTEEQLLMEDLEKSAEQIIYSDDVYNLLLIGSDGRVEDLERSDSMIVVSINRTTKDIWLTSLMRDCQVMVPNWGMTHLNWCTRMGGIDMLISAIESPENFGLQIDNWAMADFLDFVQVAELLGPVSVSITVEEAEDMNKAIREVCQLIDASEGRQLNDPNNIERPYFPTDQDGTYTLTNGIQILGYCRERHVGGDTGRSVKQRDVLTQMWENAKKMTVMEQFNLMEKLLPVISTDLSAGKCASLLLQLPALLEYKIHTQQCPVEGSFFRTMDKDNLSIYNVDFFTNRNYLRATIYHEPMTIDQLTSRWLGYPMVIYDPENPDAPAPTQVPW